MQYPATTTIVSINPAQELSPIQCTIYLQNCCWSSYQCQSPACEPRAREVLVTTRGTKECNCSELVTQSSTAFGAHKFPACGNQCHYHYVGAFFQWILQFAPTKSTQNSRFSSEQDVTSAQYFRYSGACTSVCKCLAGGRKLWQSGGPQPVHCAQNISMLKQMNELN